AGAALRSCRIRGSWARKKQNGIRLRVSARASSDRRSPGSPAADDVDLFRTCDPPRRTALEYRFRCGSSGQPNSSWCEAARAIAVCVGSFIPLLADHQTKEHDGVSNIQISACGAQAAPQGDNEWRTKQSIHIPKSWSNHSVSTRMRN